MKLKGIDGGPHKRWSMWFNSMIREEPYQGLNGSRQGWKHLFLRATLKVLHGCRQLVPSGVRLSPITSATPAVTYKHVMMVILTELPVQTVRKVGMTSNHHGPYVLGHTRATMAGTESSQWVTTSESIKPVTVRIGVCNSTP